jgi:predicted small secreted protein
MMRSLGLALVLVAGLAGCATTQGMVTDLKNGVDTVAGWFGG